MTAYDPDERIIALAVRARLHWFQADPEKAWALAEASLQAGVVANHAHSFCWALAYQLIPVMVWSGRLDRARDFTTVLLDQAHDTFNTWYEWGLLQARALEAIRQDAGFEPLLVDLERAIPGQADLFATYHPRLAARSALSRATRGRVSWCSPELQRLQALKDLERGQRLEARSQLAQALCKARRQQAWPWALRIALDLAKAASGDDAVSAAEVLRLEVDRWKPAVETDDLLAARAWLRKRDGLVGGSEPSTGVAPEQA